MHFPMFGLILLSLPLSLLAEQVPILASPAISSIINCGSQPSDLFTPSHVSISPDPPVLGEKAVLTLTGTLSSDIVQGSYADVKVKLGLIQLIKQQFDICKEIVQFGETCPLKEGPVSIVKDIDIPTIVPPGRYSVHVEAFNADGAAITCYNIAVKL